MYVNNDRRNLASFWNQPIIKDSIGAVVASTFALIGANAVERHNPGFAAILRVVPIFAGGVWLIRRIFSLGGPGRNDGQPRWFSWPIALRRQPQVIRPRPQPEVFNDRDPFGFGGEERAYSMRNARPLPERRGVHTEGPLENNRRPRYAPASGPSFVAGVAPQAAQACARPAVVVPLGQTDLAFGQTQLRLWPPHRASLPASAGDRPLRNDERPFVPVTSASFAPTVRRDWQQATPASTDGPLRTDQRVPLEHKQMHQLPQSRRTEAPLPSGAVFSSGSSQTKPMVPLATRR